MSEHEQNGTTPPNDGSQWLKMVTEVVNEDRTITPIIGNRLRNALLAEIIAYTKRPEVLELVTVTFPKTHDGKPALRIHLAEKAPEELKNLMSDFIARKTEHHGSTETAQFHALRTSAEMTVQNVGGYHGRADTTITTNTVDDLVAAVATMMSNPFIKKELLQSPSVRGKD